jgi:hypothetical protein
MARQVARQVARLMFLLKVEKLIAMNVEVVDCVKIV